MIVQAAVAVRSTQSCTEGHVVLAGEADVAKERRHGNGGEELVEHNSSNGNNNNGRSTSNGNDGGNGARNAPRRSRERSG